MSFYCAKNPGCFRVEEVATRGEWQARLDRVTIDRLKSVCLCYVRCHSLSFHSHSFPLFYFIPLRTMQMDGWSDYLHTSLYGEHALFPVLRLTSFGSFITAAALAASICLAERSLTFALMQHWTPCQAVRQSRARSAFWRAGLYSLATFLRLLYMLLSMTFHVWLILVIVRGPDDCRLSDPRFMLTRTHGMKPHHRSSRSQPVNSSSSTTSTRITTTQPTKTHTTNTA